MPRKALSCTAVIHIQQVTCPGTRHLPDRNMLFVRVSMLGERKRTKSVFATFPLYFNERLYFERTFTNSREPSHVMEMMEEENIILELIQYSEIYKHGKCLARYEQSAREFLYPSPTLTGKDGFDREVLMSRTSNFTGIDPKLEFCTITTLEETTIPGTYSKLTTVHYSSEESEDDESESTEEEIIVTAPAKLNDPSKSSTVTDVKHCVCECPKRPENRGKVVVRSRSLSPNYKKDKTSVQNKPPFKTGKADKSLISKRDFQPRHRSGRKRMRTPVSALGEPVPCTDCVLPHPDCIVCQAYYRVFGNEFLKLRFTSASGHRRSATLPAVTSKPSRLRKARLPGDEEGSDNGLNESMAYSLPIPRSSNAALFSLSMNGSYLTSTKGDSLGLSVRNPIKPVSYVDNGNDSSDSDDSLLSLQELRYDIDDARLDSLDRSFEDPEHPTLGTRLDRSITVPLNQDEHWSHTKAVYTGRSHRQMFDQSINHIYHDLYERSKFL